MNIGEGISGAVFSDDRQFRFALWRIWDKSKKALLFIGLNPSTANEIRDDPTIQRVIKFAKFGGYGGIFVGNLFALVTPVPEGLRRRPTHYARNMAAIKRMRELSAATLAGWGNFGNQAGTRPAVVLALVGEPVYCLKVNSNGEPSHPLYIAYSTKLIRYHRKGESK